MSPVCSLLHKGARRTAARMQRGAALRHRKARLCRGECTPHFLFETSKRKCAVHGGKEKMSGMSCPAKRSTHPKRGLTVTHFRPNPEVSYRLRYPHSFRNCVPAPVGTPHIRLQNRIGVFLLPRVPLRYALPGPFPALSSSPVQLREGFPKGRAAARPFVSFQGGAGGN